MNAHECSNRSHLNRPGTASKQQRRARKLNTHNWFKKKPKSQQETEKSTVSNTRKKRAPEIEAMMFCPYTPNSQLKKELTAAEAFLTRNQRVGRVRFVERAGPKLKNLLCNKAPWNKTWCERAECQPCKTSPGSCRAVNIV